MALMSRVMNSILAKPGRNPAGVDEPMINDELGRFNALRIGVSPTSSAANWGLRGNDIEYIVPQTQEEHNKLLNTFYHQRDQYPDWKERGQLEEQKSPHFTPKDAVPRKNLRARSSVIKDIAFDPEKNMAWLKMGRGDKWYAYSATPEQFKSFMMSGSLGKEMNNIKQDRSTSMMKTAARVNPQLKSGWQAADRGSILSRIGRLFGF